MNEIISKPVKPDHVLDDLYYLLTREVSVYDNILETLQSEQNSIVSGNIEEVHSQTTNIKSLVKEANAIAIAQSAKIKEYYEKNGVKESTVTLPKLINHLNRSVKSKWVRLDKQLNSIIKKIEKLNRENKGLLQVSIDFVKESVQIIFPQEKNADNSRNKNIYLQKDKRPVLPMNWKF